MKRIAVLIIALSLVFSLVSCSEKPKDQTDETTDSPFDIQTSENVSADRFESGEILSFAHSEGTVLLEENNIFAIYNDSSAKCIPFSDPEQFTEYSNAVAPFGVNIGDTLSTLEKSFSLDSGYAAYVKKGGSLQMYDKDKATDITGGEGGCMFFGYAEDESGKWMFMDYMMLTATISGQLVIQGATEAHNVVVYSCIINDDLTVEQITAVYGEINVVMAIIS